MRFFCCSNFVSVLIALVTSSLKFLVIDKRQNLVSVSKVTTRRFLNESIATWPFSCAIYDLVSVISSLIGAMMMCGHAGNNNTTIMIQMNEGSIQVPDILLMLVASLGVLLNGMIFSRKCLPKSCSLFIYNLAAADLGTSIFAFVLGFRRIIPYKILKKVTAIMSWSTTMASFLILFAIAVQRYLIVAHSLWSYSRMNDFQKLYKLIIIGIWFLALLFGLFLYYFTRITALILTCLDEIMIIMIIALYLQIYSTFRSYILRDKTGIFGTNEFHSEKGRQTFGGRVLCYSNARHWNAT